MRVFLIFIFTAREVVVVKTIFVDVSRVKPILIYVGKKCSWESLNLFIY